MKPRDLSRLVDLAGLLLDHRLGSLRQIAQAKAQSEMALSVLGRPVPDQEDGLEGVSAELSKLAYQRWADARRGEINLTLARQTHAWLEAKADAQVAFGKAEALKRLAKK